MLLGIYHGLSRTSVGSGRQVPWNRGICKVKSDLLTKISLDPVSVPVDTKSKVTVVGSGSVGMAATFSILIQGISNNVVLIDREENRDRLEGEMLDLQHGSVFLKNSKINASTDYADSAGSGLCIITAGVRQKEGETRRNLAQLNTDVLKHIVPQLVKYSPHTILLVVSNPVDILTYVSWKLSGLNQNRVIGSGTNLDSSRFRFLIAKELGLAPSSCHGWIIGEHGDSSVAVWSHVNVAGVRFRDVNPFTGNDEDDPEKWAALHQKVIHAAEKIIGLKGYTNWAVGVNVAALASTILTNSLQVRCVSVNVKDLLGLTADTYMSLPAVLGENGVINILNLRLDGEEFRKLKKCADDLLKIQNELKF